LVRKDSNIFCFIPFCCRTKFNSPVLSLPFAPFCFNYHISDYICFAELEILLCSEQHIDLLSDKLSAYFYFNIIVEMHPDDYRDRYIPSGIPVKPGPPSWVVVPKPLEAVSGSVHLTAQRLQAAKKSFKQQGIR
jgi:hypothetical protein